MLSKKSVSFGDILWKTTFWMEDFPLLKQIDTNKYTDTDTDTDMILIVIHIHKTQTLIHTHTQTQTDRHTLINTMYT